ncbi:MAG: hypothetical protein WC413_04615 [Candidatus Nanoarchaeia archaeon]
MAEEKESLHQQIMNEAYILWQINKDWDTEEFFDHLNFIQRVAIALGNLNYQVGNGGFSQWKWNHYAEAHFSFLSRLMNKIDKKIYPQLNKALDIMMHFIEKYGVKESKADICISEEKYDDEFYSLKNLEKEMEKFISEIEK